MEQIIKWSHSAVNTLRQCNRKYYLGHIVATHGRRNPLRRKAYELKHMQSITMWKGSVVDKFMETVIIPMIRDKKDLDFSVLADDCVALAKEQFQFSRWKAHTDEGLRKSDADREFCILDIHELGKPYSETDLAEVYHSIHQAIGNFPFIRMPDGKLLLTFLQECFILSPNVMTWSATVENARITPQIDLLAFHNYKPVVMDWKFAASDVSDYSRQLLVCGVTIYLKRLANINKLPWQYQDISLYEVNILKGTVIQHELTEDRFNDTINYINLTGDDFGLLHARYEDADVDDFEFTDDESSCALCNLRPLCTYLLHNNNEYDEKAYNEFVRTYQPAQPRFFLPPGGNQFTEVRRQRGFVQSSNAEGSPKDSITYSRSGSSCS